MGMYGYVYVFKDIHRYILVHEVSSPRTTYTLFFVRTKFIRTLSLRFGQMLRTFLTLKSPSFLIVLKVKY